MRILFVSPYYKPYLGGIERVIEKLAHQFKDNFNTEKVGVLTSKWSFPRKNNPDWLKRETVDSEDIIRLDSWPHKAPPFFQVPLVWFSPWEIKRSIQEFQPDIIQLMSDRFFWVNFWVIFWAKQFQVPVFFSLSFHQLSFWQQWLRPINAILTQWVDKVIVITEHERELVHKSYKTPKKKFAVVPWGVEKTQKTPSPDSARPSIKQYQEEQVKLKNQDNKTITILAVGRISKHKGQEWLARVYEQTKLEISTRLVLVGEVEDPGAMTKIKKIKLSKDKEITITDKVTDLELECHYQTADVFVLFPEYEAFGLVFLEAMIHGIPVLTHKVGAIEEVLKDGTILVDRYNQDQAVENLTKLVNDSKLRDNLGREARKYAQDRYSWEKTAGKFVEMYQQYRQCNSQ